MKSNLDPETELIKMHNKMLIYTVIVLLVAGLVFCIVYEIKIKNLEFQINQSYINGTIDQNVKVMSTYERINGLLYIDRNMTEQVMEICK